jgi:hypothetical protein
MTDEEHALLTTEPPEEVGLITAVHDLAARSRRLDGDGVDGLGARFEERNVR